MTVAEALAHSINTVAVRLANEVGARKIGELAHRFGLKSIPDQPGPVARAGRLRGEPAGADLAATRCSSRAASGPAALSDQQIPTARGDSLYAHAAAVAGARSMTRPAPATWCG